MYIYKLQPWKILFENIFVDVGFSVTELLFCDYYMFVHKINKADFVVFICFKIAMFVWKSQFWQFVNNLIFHFYYVHKIYFCK